MNVILLLTFVVICFSIIGMQFWKGLLHARCRLTPYPVILPKTCDSIQDHCWNDYMKNVTENPAKYRCLEDDNDNNLWTQSTSPWFTQGPQDCFWPIDDTDERVCNLNANGGHTCSSIKNSSKFNVKYTTCGSNFDSFGNPRFIDDNRPYGYPRMLSATFTDTFNWGFTCYDSFVTSFFTSFQVITLEGWSDIMYQGSDAGLKLPAVIIFTCQVIICGYIVLNFVLAVITKSIDELEQTIALTVEGEHADDKNSAGGGDTPIEGSAAAGGAEEGRRCSSTISKNSQDCWCFQNDHENVDIMIKLVETPNRLQKLVEMQCYSVFITSCIILNTVVLCLDYYGIPERNADMLENINVVFTVIFIIDVIFSNIAFGLKKYWG